jgi:uncharacterized HAD superfamily protein
MRIGIDVDEVLAETIVSILEHHNEKYKTNFSKEDVLVYELWKTWGGTREESSKKVDEYFESEKFSSLLPIEEAKEVIKSLGKNHELFVVTSRPNMVQKQTIEWLEQHFPSTFKKVLFTNHWDKNSPNKLITKAELCEKEKIEIMIEDNSSYASECAKVCKKVILMDQPWNRKDTFLKNVIRIHSWKEAEAVIE